MDSLLVRFISVNRIEHYFGYGPMPDVVKTDQIDF